MQILSVCFTSEDVRLHGVRSCPYAELRLWARQGLIGTVLAIDSDCLTAIQGCGVVVALPRLRLRLQLRPRSLFFIIRRRCQDYLIPPLAQHLSERPYACCRTITRPCICVRRVSQGVLDADSPPSVHLQGESQLRVRVFIDPRREVCRCMQILSVCFTSEDVRLHGVRSCPYAELRLWARQGLIGTVLAIDSDCLTAIQGCGVVVALPRLRLRLQLRPRSLFFIIVTCPVGSDSDSDSHYKSYIASTTPGDSDSDSTTLSPSPLYP